MSTAEEVIETTLHHRRCVSVHTNKRRKQRAEYEDDDDDDIVDDIDEVGDIDEDNDDDDDNGEHSQHHYKSKRLRIKAENPSSQTLPAMEDRRYDDNDEEM
jgi:hypothetical protein